MDDKDVHNVFRFFTEVGIIAQLSSALIERHLPERVTSQHFGLLGHLDRRPDGSTPQQLAYAFQIPKTTMTHMIRVLQTLDLIEVVPNPRDARSKVARITGGGRSLLHAAIAKAAADVAAMDPAMDLDVVAKTLPGLAAVREQLDEARDKERAAVNQLSTLP